MEAASTLAVKTKVLCVRLGNAQLEALLNKVTDGPAVARKVTRSEALVGRVKEGKVFLRANDLSNLLPLILGRVHTRGVVGASVQHNDAAFVSALQGAYDAIKVEALCLFGEVGISLGCEANVGEDLEVVRPSGVGEVRSSLGVRLVELGEEEGAQMDGAGA